MKSILTSLCLALGILVSFAATAPRAELAAVPLANTQMNASYKAEKAALKAARKAELAAVKASKKAERQAKFALWLAKNTAAGTQNWGAIVLAFFLGWLGIHRVVMGGSPLLIVGYIFTFGGLFGLLPLIDFIRLIIDSSHYQDNSRFFRAFE